jgi:hypothetical protein
MNNKAAELNKAIDAIPGICADGRKAIRNLVGKITDTNLTPEPEVLYHIGQRVHAGVNDYILCLAYKGGSTNDVQAVDLETGHVRRAAFGVGHHDSITKEEMRRIVGDLAFEVIA